MGVTLVAALYDGTFQGRAWLGNRGGELARVIGESIPDVLKQLRQAIDVPERRNAFRKTLLEKHAVFLRSRGIVPEKLSAQQLEQLMLRVRRVTHCYGCKSPLDNAVDLECLSCKWIPCGHCGACGCGYESQL